MNGYFVAENLYRKFDSVEIDVSFACERETITSIVGPSGSGKSTVLKLISGLEKSDSGKDDKADFGKLSQRPDDNLKREKIILDGEDITNLPPAKRGVGMVFQSRSLFNHMNVGDNVSYGLVSKGIRKSQARKMAAEFLKSFNLEGFEKRMPDTLSGGEAQRVALARTLIVKPKLVLFDEVFSALDAPLRKKLSSLILELKDSFKFTGIMVTHDIEEAKRMSDRIILIKKGKLTWQGKPSEFDENMLS